MNTDASLAKALRAMSPDVRKATVFLDAKLVVSICRRHKYAKRNTREDMVVKIGQPNYAERNFIAQCKKAGVPLPLNKVQLKFWPANKKVIR
jgi:hypothetical protein